MKRTIIGILLILLSFPLHSQELQSKVFDKKGRLIQRNRVNFFGKIENDYYDVGIIKYEYDKKGNLTRKSYFDKDGKPFDPENISKELPEIPSYTLYEYNKEDKVMMISNHFLNGTLVDLANHPAVKKFRYNDFNQLVEEYNFNKMGQLRGIGDVEIALVRYTYMRNRLTQKISLDENKKIINFGLNVAEYSYDDQNRVNKISYYFANSELYLNDLFFYNDKGQLIKEEAYKKDGKLDYAIKYTYFDKQPVQREYRYFNGVKKIEKHGIELHIPGWKMQSIPVIEDVNDVDGIGSFLVTIDKAGRILDIKKSYGSNALVYAIMPYLRQMKIVKDESVTKVSLRGEIKVGILNTDQLVDEF